MMHMCSRGKYKNKQMLNTASVRFHETETCFKGVQSGLDGAFFDCNSALTMGKQRYHADIQLTKSKE